ncbi:tyrosine-type recombinase/integrase [Sphingomonas pokkalii]|uniref:Integrase n=1 Tax=Sphingomonas pokkalii TaxID=2175090 RepID=A0A2U0SI22_9SPHN|nr:integrase arm-type DNA-binding domain-containing protein [Sphingomonas pokkalii]PVX30988.1 integrase [Sphingomonas pokkalii]
MLTDLQCRKAAAREKPYKLTDANGLYLYVTPAGAKSWRFKYRFGARPDSKPGQVERKLVLGTYPEVTLLEAREARDAARKLLREGIDPGVRRRQQRAAASVTAQVTFESIARELHQIRARSLDARYSQQIMERLERHVFPDLGTLPITEITAPLVLEVVRAVEETGAIEMAHRVRSHISDVFVHAIATGRGMMDPAAIISKALVARSPKLRPAQTKIEAARSALVAVESAPVYWGTLLASRLLALTAARPGVVQLAERGEFEQLDTSNPIWRIPAAKMKLTRKQKRDLAYEFVIPLSTHAAAVVKLALELSGSTYLFPGYSDPRKPISNSTISRRYRDAGLTGRHVPHGWRASFSTIMNEQAALDDRLTDREIIDMMLAHIPGGVEVVYNRSLYMGRRRDIGQSWGDMLMKGMPAPADLVMRGARIRKR